MTSGLYVVYEVIVATGEAEAISKPLFKSQAEREAQWLNDTLRHITFPVQYYEVREA